MHRDFRKERHGAIPDPEVFCRTASKWFQADSLGLFFFFVLGFFLLSCPEKTTEFIAAGNTSPRFAVTAKHAVILAECGPPWASQGASHQHPLTKGMTPLWENLFCKQNKVSYRTQHRTNPPSHGDVPNSASKKLFPCFCLAPRHTSCVISCVQIQEESTENASLQPYTQHLR